MVDLLGSAYSSWQGSTRAAIFRGTELMKLAPVTAAYLGNPAAVELVPPLLLSVLVMVLFCVVTLWAAAVTARRAGA